MPGGRVKFEPDRGSALTLLVAGPPERGGGVGGWVASERGLRRPAKFFKGLPDDTYSWDLIIDIDAVGGPAVERRIQVLREMGQPGEEDEPPSILLSGDVWTLDQAVPWVLDDMTLGDRLWNPDGTLRRQHVQVKLSRYTPVSEIEAIKVRSTRKGGKKRRRQVVARGNDTLRVIALRELGDQSRWKDLRRWNKKLAKVNPDARLRSGLHITLR